MLDLWIGFWVIYLLKEERVAMCTKRETKARKKLLSALHSIVLNR